MHRLIRYLQSCCVARPNSGLKLLKLKTHTTYFQLGQWSTSRIWDRMESLFDIIARGGRTQEAMVHVFNASMRGMSELMLQSSCDPGFVESAVKALDSALKLLAAAVLEEKRAGKAPLPEWANVPYYRGHQRPGPRRKRGIRRSKVLQMVKLSTVHLMTPCELTMHRRTS
jgi:hypothetical protein